MIQEARDNANMPFDELYHTQKKVIQEVIDAEKALQDKMDSLPDPYDQFSIDKTKLSAEQRSEVEDIIDSLSSPFTVSQKRRKEALLDERLKQIQSGSQSGAYKFDYSETADLKSQVEQGLMS